MPARRHLAPVVQRRWKNRSFLVTHAGLLRVIRHRLRYATWQRTITRVRKENLVARDGEFALAEFFVRENFGKRHG